MLTAYAASGFPSISKADDPLFQLSLRGNSSIRVLQIRDNIGFRTEVQQWRRWDLVVRAGAPEFL
ncbi:hypothetical protein IEQ34_007057 [Dendrobium chrysotoxum]|uniref:Uncharacterized protein n=1 Tax=Dendrobium chrysotoxum TaxID=161865 RepID=A0AAV7H6S7_DENCH|nr:hypothetical protein IEQ34_007057 [Dendrobium chrysotoxum]